jgi:hypothetical protein
LTWLDAWDSASSHPRLAAITAALCIGLLAFTRPLTAVGVALPFAPHAAILFLRGDWRGRRRMLAFGLVALAVASLLFVWQWAVTGDPLFNPYTLWWKYDKLGFGPGVGRLEGGHTLRQAWINTKFSLFVGWHDTFGWWRFSWIFLPFGALALFFPRNAKEGAVQKEHKDQSLHPPVGRIVEDLIARWLENPAPAYDGLPNRPTTFWTAPVSGD